MQVLKPHLGSIVGKKKVCFSSIYGWFLKYFPASEKAVMKKYIFVYVITFSVWKKKTTYDTNS